MVVAYLHVAIDVSGTIVLVANICPYIYSIYVTKNVNICIKPFPFSMIVIITGMKSVSSVVNMILDPVNVDVMVWVPVVLCMCYRAIYAPT